MSRVSSLCHIFNIQVRDISCCSCAQIETVATDDRYYITNIFGNYVHAASWDTVECFALHWQIDHPIDQEPGKILPYCQIFNLSDIMLKSLITDIEVYLANRFMLQLSSPETAPNFLQHKLNSWPQLGVH